tara:strand:+ start:740 stop:1681 length:942 start_codon:yes stop_codon:yes gene_type:complete
VTASGPAERIVRHRLFFLSGWIVAFVGLLWWMTQNRPVETTSQPPVAVKAQQPVNEAVAALGQLEPAGEVIQLAAPSVGMAGSPRISRLFVEEGDTIAEGQVLAEFDHRSALLADLDVLDARLFSIHREIQLQKKEISRFRLAADWGAASLTLLEGKQEELVRLEGRRDETKAERKGLLVKLAKSQLKSPIEGLVLQLNARTGERPSSDGVMEIGASQAMRASVEVYESDVARVRIGQTVTLTSENGGFKDALKGQVIRISPQVQQRQVLSTDPTGDADARIVEVHVALSTADAERVSRLSGLKVIARFDPAS